MMEAPVQLHCRHFNLIVVLGATASGKTRVGVELAATLGGEIISADSRQVFRGMDIGTGKDLFEYGDVPYHLIDVTNPGDEFSLFTFLRLFNRAFDDISGRGKLPLLVGGTGLYLDAVVRAYRLAEVPPNPELRAELSRLDDARLVARLLRLNSCLHNTTDLLDRDRLIRAIEIAENPGGGTVVAVPNLNPVVFGLRWEREALRRRITARLRQRLQDGLIAEVDRLLTAGITAETLDAYGLEYRYITRYLRGELNRNDMVQKLAGAIHDFAKRQETWFRRMERNGVKILWVDGAGRAAEEILGYLAEDQQQSD